MKTLRNRCASYSGAVTLIPRDNQTAGRAVAGVAGRIGHVVVEAGMNHQSAAVGIKGGRRACFERDRIGQSFKTARAVLGDEHVRQIAGVRAVGIFQPVLSLLGVKVPARAGECRPFTFTDRMDVNRVQAGCQTLNFQAHEHTVWFFTKACSTDDFAVFIFQLRRGSRTGRDHGTTEEES